MLFVPVGPVCSQTVDFFNPGANALVYTMALQSDDEIVVGGSFSALGGVNRAEIGRLDARGAPDAGFNPGAGLYVSALAVQVDGGILVGGMFSRLGGETRNHIGRLDTSGSLDATFNPGANDRASFLVRPDGSTVVAGAFTMLAGQPRNHLGLLRSDGTLDPVFDPSVSGAVVDSLAGQADRKILIAGVFTAVAGQARTNLARLNADGTPDLTFQASIDGPVYCMAEQADGRIVVGGQFATAGDQPHACLARLEADGTVDASFTIGTDGGAVNSMAVQADGKILVSGFFARLGGEARNYIARLNADGSLDPLFNPWANDYVNSVVLQPDGKILTGGWFGSLGGQSRYGIARLNNADPATESLAFDGSSVVWLRGGSSPEVWCTTFEACTNGTDWVNIGPGERVRGGWQRTGLNLPAPAIIRARGFVAGGWRNGSSWFVEAILEAPVVTRQPSGLTNAAGTMASFCVHADGAPPLSYQWRKDGVDLSDGGAISGARASVLWLSPVYGADAGEYSVVVTNSLGAVTSSVAMLGVQDPCITAQPLDRTAAFGQTIALTVTVGATPPIGYQWYRGEEALNDGGNISGAHTSSLSLSNVYGGDAGGYSVIVSNSYGTVTSGVATLRVADPMILTQPASQSVTPGQPVALSVAAVGTAPAYQWRKDGLDITGATMASLTLTNAQGADAGGYSVVVSSVFGSVTSALSMVTVNVANPGSFNPGAGYSNVFSLVEQADGRVLVGGAFTNLAGQWRSGLGRLNADGSLDGGFNPASRGSTFYCVTVQTDGRILVGGAFTTLGGQTRNNIGRLDADGSLDTAFNPNANHPVLCLLEQADGKILAGGIFTTLGGHTHLSIGRLNRDGTPDDTFNPSAGGWVNTLALQPDGTILVGGIFSALDGVSSKFIGRLRTDGTVDTNFNCSANGPVNCLLVQPDGRILVGGQFTMLGGETRNYLGRLNVDGSLDTSFNPGANNQVISLALQTDGKILVGGRFTVLAGQARSYVGRLNADGTVDVRFNPTAEGGTVNPGVYALALQTDGEILVGGGFTTLGQVPRSRIARLSNTELATQSLAFDGSTATWLRGGASPEVWCTSLDACTNATDWFSQGGGVRMPGGWQWTGLALPTNSTIRVRGFVADGYFNGSSRFVETSAGPPRITANPVSQVLTGGQSVVFSVMAAGTPPLSYQWRKNGTNVPGANWVSLALTNVQATDLAGYDVLVSNLCGCTTSAVAVLRLQAAPDQWNPQANAAVNCLTLQADGRILVGGNFTALGGQNRMYIARMGAHGTVDNSFGGSANGPVSCLTMQPDGKILAGGSFGTLGGQTRNRIGRLDSDGLTDAAFDPGANNTVYCLVVQPDNKILVGGAFTTLAGQSRSYIGRLNDDGSLDEDFNPEPNGSVYSVAVQVDGTILLGGNFTTLAGQPCSRIARLHPDGTLDTGFNPGASGTVYCLQIQNDGKILVGGAFTMLGDQACNYLGRLNAGGTRDATFNPGANNALSCLALQADGRILVGGSFTSLGGQTHYRLGRLNPDGTLDTAFNPSASDTVSCLLVQADGRTLVGGSFLQLSVQNRQWLGRLNNTDPATQNLSFDGSTISWLRGGASPECWRTTFEASTNGRDWFILGEGERVAGGWQWTQANLPLDTVIRGRGFLTAGLYNGSGSIVEATWNPLFIASQPLSQTVVTGQTVVLSVTAGGFAPFAYHWRKDGVLLAGETEASLTLTNMQWVNGGSYDVTVTSAYGSLTSAEAVLAFPLTADTFSGAASGSGSVVSSMVEQWDGKILVGGKFTALGGWACANIGRLNPDGSPDRTFHPGANDQIFSMAVQPDGKILVGGWFTVLGGQARGYLGRLNPDGTLDPLFNPSAGGGVTYPGVYGLAVQPDGKIVVGGDFRKLGGQACMNIGRLNSDGILDTNFYATANDVVYPVALQPDGKILLAGAFSILNGEPRSCIGRLNPDGSLDTAFNPGVSSTPVAIIVQADGKILVGGGFSALAGQGPGHLGRLNPDGSLDTLFNPEANSTVRTVVLQADRKILVGGEFTGLGGRTRTYIGRLNADGTLDTTFDPAAGGYVYSLAVQPGGKLLVGGAFTTLAGEAHTNIGRLNPTYPATDSLAFDGTSVTWLRSGTSPEFWRTTFDASSNGLEWLSLPAGARISGGWQLTGLHLPTTVTVRARGFVAAGRYNGSTWFVESLTRPVIEMTDGGLAGRSNQFGFTVRAALGSAVFVEASTNLTDWSTLTSSTLATGTLDFSEPTPQVFPRRFYRVRLP